MKWLTRVCVIDMCSFAYVYCALLLSVEPFCDHFLMVALRFDLLGILSCESRCSLVFFPFTSEWYLQVLFASVFKTLAHISLILCDF